MRHPYRTPSAGQEAGPGLHSCDGDDSRCDPASRHTMVELLLRDQIAWQKKLARLGKIALVLLVLPWLLLGTSVAISSIEKPPTVVAAACEHRPELVSEAPAARQTLRPVGWNASPAVQQGIATPVVRAKGHANKALLHAFERGIPVRHVVLTGENLSDVFADSDLRTRVIPVELSGGRTGVKLVRLSESSWFWKVGFATGDVLLSLNGIGLGDPEAAVRAFYEAENARHAVFVLERDGEARAISLTW